MNYILQISKHYTEHIDSIFTVNFTLLAFIVTAITILLMLQSGRLVSFKEAGLMDDVLSYFYKSLNYNFFSGIFALLIWIIKINLYYFYIITFFISLILLVLALYNTYQSYKFLLFFVKKQ